MHVPASNVPRYVHIPRYVHLIIDLITDLGTCTHLIIDLITDLGTCTYPRTDQIWSRYVHIP